MKQARFVVAGVAAIGGAAAAHARQWIELTDQTAARLQLTSVPAGDPEEKDVAVADFDRDGWDDVVVVRKKPFSNPGPRFDVLLMNEHGVLVDRTGLLAPGFLVNATDSRDVVAADLTGDGWADLAIGSTFGDRPRFYRNRGPGKGGQWLGLVDESARFGPIVGTPIALLKVCGITAGDIDHDQDLDLYLSVYSGGDDILFVNDGSGNFTDQTAARVGLYANSAFGTAAEIRDVDADGDHDIVKCTTLYSEPPFGLGVYILWNNGQGDFDALPFGSVPALDSPYMFAAGELSGDDRLDLYIVQDGQDQVKLMTARAPHAVSFAGMAVSSSRTTGFGGNTHLADLDGDGDQDVGVSPIDVDIANCGPGSHFALLRNNGQGQLSDPWAGTMSFHVDAHDFAFVDIDRDGCLDLFQGLCAGYRVLMRTDCPPSACYPNCDGSTGAGGTPTLNVNDYICFQTRFALGDPYADCDANGIRNVNDYICFQTRFALGCP